MITEWYENTTLEKIRLPFSVAFGEMWSTKNTELCLKSKTSITLIYQGYRSFIISTKQYLNIQLIGKYIHHY